MSETPDLVRSPALAASGDGSPAHDRQDAGQSGDPAAFRPLGHAPAGVSNGAYDPAAFEGLDFYRIDDLLSDEEKGHRDAVRAYVSEGVLPVIEQHAQALTFPLDAARGLAALGVIGPTIPAEYGGLGASSVTYGLMMQEVERADSGLRSFCSVMGSLVMYPIYTYGSEEQKRRWLPRLATADAIGCFALTEPDVGSDPGSMTTRATRDGDEFVLSGHKRWSTNASIADVAVVWAKDDAGDVRGFLVETDRPGVSTPRIMDKWSLRAAVTSEVVLDDVRVPASAMLPNVKGLKGPLSCLSQARYGIAWGVLGAAMACYDAAIQHTTSREQFGRPVAGFQLVQNHIADMLADITKAQLVAWRLGRMKDEGTMRPAHVSLAKRDNVRTALAVARQSRQLLGGNGVLGIYPVMRHMANLESVVTYEGTDEVHTLVLGQEATGLNAFS
ncbi:acyl-CoA dehydrogenase family protein [Rubrivirga sp.]|uniref:acyl-CoA dehydrogenase family protein n=1 Tax=Rubrivirga sp. TaxID=1885344 RepID=UPI003B515F46